MFTQEELKYILEWYESIVNEWGEIQMTPSEKLLYEKISQLVEQRGEWV